VLAQTQANYRPVLRHFSKNARGPHRKNRQTGKNCAIQGTETIHRRTAEDAEKCDLPQVNTDGQWTLIKRGGGFFAEWR
jgi:hypothetical protein